MIGHLGAEIGFRSFHRNWWKYAQPPIILTSAYILACRAGTTSRYSTWGTPPIKAEQPGLCSHLGSAWERQHIYKDLNESSSASPGGSQQLEIPPSPNSKLAANFFQIRWYFTRRGDFNARQDSIVLLYFCQTPTFWKAPTFCKSANILGVRWYFTNPLIFSERPQYLWICLIFVAANIWVYFSIYLCIWVCPNIFGSIVLTLGLRLL